MIKNGDSLKILFYKNNHCLSIKYENNLITNYKRDYIDLLDRWLFNYLFIYLFIVIQNLYKYNK